MKILLEYHYTSAKEYFCIDCNIFVPDTLHLKQGAVNFIKNNFCVRVYFTSSKWSLKINTVFQNLPNYPCSPKVTQRPYQIIVMCSLTPQSICVPFTTVSSHRHCCNFLVSFQFSQRRYRGQKFSDGARSKPA